MVRLSFFGRRRSEVKALGRDHEWFQIFNQRHPIKILAFDTSNLLLFLVREESSPSGISFIAVAFLAQTIWLKKSNSKEPERIRCCCSSRKRRNQPNEETARSTNEEQVFSPLDQSGVSNFTLSERKIKKQTPSVSTNQHSVNFQLPSMLYNFKIPNIFFWRLSGWQPSKKFSNHFLRNQWKYQGNLTPFLSLLFCDW